jgi:hypothetical protein
MLIAAIVFRHLTQWVKKLIKKKPEIVAPKKLKILIGFNELPLKTDFCEINA